MATLSTARPDSGHSTEITSSFETKTLMTLILGPTRFKPAMPCDKWLSAWELQSYQRRESESFEIKEKVLIAVMESRQDFPKSLKEEGDDTWLGKNTHNRPVSQKGWSKARDWRSGEGRGGRREDKKDLGLKREGDQSEQLFNCCNRLKAKGMSVDTDRPADQGWICSEVASNIRGTSFLLLSNSSASNEFFSAQLTPPPPFASSAHTALLFLTRWKMSASSSLFTYRPSRLEGRAVHCCACPECHFLSSLFRSKRWLGRSLINTRFLCISKFVACWSFPPGNYKFHVSACNIASLGREKVSLWNSFQLFRKGWQHPITANAILRWRWKLFLLFSFPCHLFKTTEWIRCWSW